MGENKPSWASRVVGSPFWPPFLSGLVLPGMGQIANGEPGKGLVLITASLGSFLWLSRVLGRQLASVLPGDPQTWRDNPELIQKAVMELLSRSPEMFTTFRFLIVLVWIYGVVDAYMTARERLRGPVRDTVTEDEE